MKPILQLRKCQDFKWAVLDFAVRLFLLGKTHSLPHFLLPVDNLLSLKQVFCVPRTLPPNL